MDNNSLIDPSDLHANQINTAKLQPSHLHTPTSRNNQDNLNPEILESNR